MAKTQSVGFIGLQSSPDRWSGKKVVSAKQSGDIFSKHKSVGHENYF